MRVIDITVKVIEVLKYTSDASTECSNQLASREERSAINCHSPASLVTYFKETVTEVYPTR